MPTMHWGVESWWPLFLLPLAIGLAWFGTRRTTPPLLGTARGVFVALRSVAFFILLLVLASPVLDRLRREERRPRIALLVDESASMSTVDAAAGTPTRLERARDAVRALHADLGDDDVAVEVVPFAAQAEASMAPDTYAASERVASGGITNVLGALRTVTDRLAGENLQALVLISDGRTTFGGPDASQIVGLGRPVFALGVGDTLRAADLAIDRCDYAPIAYMESETLLQVRIENSGFRGKSVPLRLSDGAHELFRRDLHFEQEHGRTQVEIPLQLSTPGRKRLTLVLEPQDGEQSTANNSREIRIEVLKNKLRVLFVAAQPDLDVAFLARTLRDDPSVELTLVHNNERRDWIRSDTGAAFALPLDLRGLQDYDLFVLGAVGSVPRAFFAGLVQVLEQGKGVLALAGRESIFTVPGSFEALADVLPVQRSGRQPVRFVVQNARLTPQGRLHPVTAPLAEVADAAMVLASLPPLLGRHVELQAKPGALPLLVADEPGELPVLVVGRFGSGHTAALTSFPIWRWGMNDREPDRLATSKFVSHLLRWLTQPQDVKRVQVTTSKPVYEGGEAVDFVAQVLDDQLQPVADAEVRLEIRRRDAAHETAATVLLERRAAKPGEYAGERGGLPPGEYAADIVATVQGAEAGRDTTEFTVETYSVEFANTSQDVSFLRDLSQLTGGRYAPLENATDLARELPRAPQAVLLHSEIEVWNSPWLFFAFVAVLGTEWLLRKRRGML